MRIGQEQRDLKISQFVSETVLVDGKHIGCYSYTEFGSKNHQGGFGMLNMQNKVVQQYENESNSTYRYLSLLQEGAKDNDVFYLTPLSKKPADPSKTWYTNTLVSQNRLHSMMKEMCKQVELNGSNQPLT